MNETAPCRPTCAGRTHPSQDSGLNQHLASAAQREYDRWDETDIDTYAGGGICHLIADAMVGVLDDHGIEASSVPSSLEVHVMVVCRTSTGVYQLDLPASTYERGAGYSWTKVPDVAIQPAWLTWLLLDPNPDNFALYLDH